jgi:hypothetical protein
MNAKLNAPIFSGIVAGSVMLSCLTLGAGRSGAGLDQPLRWIAALLGSEPALIMAGQAMGGVSVPTLIVFAFLIHFVTAIAMARLFLHLTDSIRVLVGWRLVAAGLAYGTTVWLIMTFVVLRVCDNVMYARVQLWPLTFLSAHLLYGVTLASCAGFTHKGIR